MTTEKDEAINELEKDRDERATDKERMAEVSYIIIDELEEKVKENSPGPSRKIASTRRRIFKIDEVKTERDLATEHAVTAERSGEEQGEAEWVKSCSGTEHDQAYHRARTLDCLYDTNLTTTQVVLAANDALTWNCTGYTNHCGGHVDVVKHYQDGAHRFVSKEAVHTLSLHVIDSRTQRFPALFAGDSGEINPNS